MEPIDVAIRDETIRLGQFLKLAGLVDTGGLAKSLIAEGAVTVNGEPDRRRGRVLRAGDVVGLAGAAARVAGPAAEGEDDYFDEATADDGFDPEKWRNL